MSEQEIQDIRRDYKKQVLDETDLLDDPIALFSKWFEEAVRADVTDVNAMTLATSDRSGQPMTRIVLLKGIEHGGFVFYTNYESQKAAHIEENNRVALCFYWPELERQVNISGKARKLPVEVSEEYFKGRPYESRIGAWASHQSKPVASRAQLEAQYEDMRGEYPDSDKVPMPPFWGGYVVIPSRIEFWQGRPGRLHDRFEYKRKDDTWDLNRLSP